MIRVRYRDSNELSPGLHAEAERRRRGTTVYLLSGLTAQERRSGTAPASGGGPAVGGAPAATTPATAPSSAAPQPAPSATSSSNGVCVDVGPLGICLHI